jgi:predicted component of type VI protein secretion system
MSKIPQGEWNAIAARYQNGESISKIARGYGCTPPAIHYILKRNRLRPVEPVVQPAQARSVEEGQARLIRANTPAPAAAPAPYVDKFNNGTAGPTLVRASALMQSPAKPVHYTPIAASAPVLQRSPEPAGMPAPRVATPALPGLDSELHLRAEAAIEMFRSSFDAALTEGSPGVCERLRQAATDLMRVAARTTMVLDRLNAIAERSDRAHNYPRSAHASDDFGKMRPG